MYDSLSFVTVLEVFTEPTDMFTTTPPETTTETDTFDPNANDPIDDAGGFLPLETNLALVTLLSIVLVYSRRRKLT